MKIEGQQAYSRSFFCCSKLAQVIIDRVFFIFYYIVLFSSALWRFLFFIRITFNFCTQNVLFTRCEVENCRQWLQNNLLFFCKQLLQLDLTEASKTNPYVQFSVFSNDRLSLIYVMRVQLDNTKQNKDIYLRETSKFKKLQLLWNRFLGRFYKIKIDLFSAHISTQ